MLWKRFSSRLLRRERMLKLFVAFVLLASVYLCAQFFTFSFEKSSQSSDSGLASDISALHPLSLSGRRQHQQLIGRDNELASDGGGGGGDGGVGRWWRGAVLPAPPNISDTDSRSVRQLVGPADSHRDPAVAGVNGYDRAVNGGVSVNNGGRLEWQGRCQFGETRRAPVEIAMLDFYRADTFENVDGGVWKQGWPIEYTESQWSVDNKLHVYVVPHSHNDPGWVKTFEQYFDSQTRHILNNAVLALEQFPDMTFVWAEISYLDLWWRQASASYQARFRRLVQSGRLEIVNGGWVMPDEAGSHFYALLEQLTSGHEWLRWHLNTTVRSGWSIDPFGLSPTQAYLLQRAGLQQLVAHRAHYRVKRQLAHRRQLEFWWRQSWDATNTTDLFCHLTPFYSYDIPHTCGPDPEVCCQFDFLRLPSGRGSCPWKKSPTPIDSSNVATKAAMLLDQYRKKAQLYRSRVLLVPLGDDFRYDTPYEWSAQRNNYRRLFDYLNSHSEFNVHVKFGTLSEYFQHVASSSTSSSSGSGGDSGGDSDGESLANGVASLKQSSLFPRLSGDFFSYADKNDDYWSGYYSTRPFYKHFDRVLIGHLRSAELMFSLYLSRVNVSRLYYVTGSSIGGDAADWSRSVTSAAVIDSLMTDLVAARRWLSLFQHHDGVTGTSKTFVMADYGRKLASAVQRCQRVLSVCASALVLPSILPSAGARLFSAHQWYGGDDSHTDTESGAVGGVDRSLPRLPERRLLRLPQDGAGVVVTVFNSLTQRPVRAEPVQLLTDSAHVEVVDVGTRTVVASQSAPVFTSMLDRQPVSAVYQLTFVASVSTYSLASFRLRAVQPNENIKHTLCTAVLMNMPPPSPAAAADAANTTNNNNNANSAPHTVHFARASATVLASTQLRAEFSSHGLLTAVTLIGRPRIETAIDFVVYGAKRGRDMSGAYLFKPNGSAVPLLPAADWPIRVIRGPISSEVTVLVANEVAHTVTVVHADESESGSWVQIDNVLSIRRDRGNRELAMRVNTSVASGDRFVTDLNTFQMIERQRFDKLPLQANFYPMPKLVFVEDRATRVSLVSAQPLGCASLAPGQIEVVMDRTLMQDDNRGVGQSIRDNVITQNSFRLMVEHMSPEHPAPQVPLISILAHLSYQYLTNPLIPLVPATTDDGRYLVEPKLQQMAVVSPVMATPLITSTVAAAADSSLADRCDIDLVTLRREPRLVSSDDVPPEPATGSNDSYSYQQRRQQRQHYRPTRDSLLTVQRVATDCRLGVNTLRWRHSCRLSNGLLSAAALVPVGHHQVSLQSTSLTGSVTSAGQNNNNNNNRHSQSASSVSGLSTSDWLSVLTPRPIEYQHLTTFRVRHKSQFH